MSVFKAILLGILQGLTEFLPISSSGHLSVAQYFMGISGTDSAILDVFLHFGTLVAVVFCFRKTILILIKEAIAMVAEIIKSKKFNFHEQNDMRKMIIYFIVSCVPLLLLLLPAGNGDKILDKVSVFSADNKILCEGFCFVLTGLLLILGSKRAAEIRRHKKMNFVYAFAVGFAQLLAAAFPGISRSGSTISTGLICGVPKKYMTRYSFILGIPAILAANIVEMKNAVLVGTELELLPVVCGIVAAAVSGVVAIRLVNVILKKNAFKYFGYYCGALGIFCIFASIIRTIIN